MLDHSRLTDADKIGQLHGVVWFSRKALEDLPSNLVLKQMQGVVDVGHASQPEVG